MKPSANLYYRVKDLHLDNIINFIIKQHELYLTDGELENLRGLNKLYREMINDVLCLRSMDFSSLKLPRLNYAKQTRICENRVDEATACTIHSGLSII